MRQPKQDTLVPSGVVSKRSGEEIQLDTPEIRAITVAIAEDFLQPIGPHKRPDIVSAAFQARLTLRILDAAGLKAVDKDAP